MQQGTFEENYKLETVDAGVIIAPSARAERDVSSQHSEVTVILDLLAADAPRFIVDVGAHDGTSLSNSYPLIEAGWSGVLIEPMSGPFAELEKLYAERSDLSILKVACAEQAGRRKLFVGADGDGGQMATLCDDDELRWHRGEEFDEIEVDTLTNVLRSCDAPADFSVLSVDAEGMDYEVLKGLDFSQFRPRIVISEEYVQNEKKHNDKYALLENNGYTRFCQLGCNTIWVAS